jgi:hypothetical protein
MAAIPVTFQGILFFSDLGVGGGPTPGGPPLGIWPGPGYPAHPIAPGGQPPGIWPSPGHPAHPIAPGGQPPGYWGGVAPPYPDQGLPGQPPSPAHPIVLPPYLPGGPPVTIWPNPVHPAHPIVIPAPPANPPEGVKPPPEYGGWGYHPDYGWGYFPGGTAVGPKAVGAPDQGLPVPPTPQQKK